MLERLADYDDALMEQLISDIEPPRDRVFDDLARELREGHVVPLLMGSATAGHGVTRLLKALRHEAPGVTQTRARLGVEPEGPALAQIIRTIHTAHGGKLSLARVLRGAFSDGAGVDRLARERGAHRRDRAADRRGLLQACARRGGRYGRLRAPRKPDDRRSLQRQQEAARSGPDRRRRRPPTQAIAIHVKDRKDEVRLAAALAKLCEEDPSLAYVQDQESGELKLLGQGEMHLRVIAERLAERFGVAVDTAKPSVAYRETIRDGVTVRGRHKKQSGGHGQFGDVLVEVGAARTRRGLRLFRDASTAARCRGSIFPPSRAGARDALTRGPLGFPVVDVAVTLIDGSYHTVDSSDMAFRAAAKAALAEALPKARPVLLEPILAVTIYVPSDALARASALVSARRGQILGFEGRKGWDGWEALRALIPEAEIGDLIVELRSATSGVGAFETKFDHLAELSGRAADAVIAARRKSLG